jgi:hypothetical protein
MVRTQVVNNRRPDVYTDVNKFSNGKPYKRVRIRIPPNVMQKFYMSIPRGFVVTMHAPNKSNNLRNENSVHNVTILANSVNPDPKYVAYSGDIDSFLANLSRIHPSIKIVSDHISEKEAGVDKPPQHFVDTILGHPGLEGSRDNLRSKAKDVIDVEMTDSQVADIESFYQREKKNFIRTRLNDGFVEDAGEDSRTHEHKWKLKMGRI